MPKKKQSQRKDGKKKKKRPKERTIFGGGGELWKICQPSGGISRRPKTDEKKRAIVTRGGTGARGKGIARKKGKRGGGRPKGSQAMN